MPWQLHRTWYKVTDYEPGEHGSVGAFSALLPDTALHGSTQIVSVDWSTPGEVEVTFLHKAWSSHGGSVR